MTVGQGEVWVGLGADREVEDDQGSRMNTPSVYPVPHIRVSWARILSLSFSLA